MVLRKFGFVADPTKTPLHNAANMLSTMPYWYYSTRPINSSCHNLCQHIPPPTNYKSLLGLGLNYIPTPRYTNCNNMTNFLERFRQDIYIKMFMAHQSTTMPRLYQRSDLAPPIHLINYNLQERTNNFIQQTQHLFQRRRCKSNLLPHQ
jgi:hypothetical protein